MKSTNQSTQVMRRIMVILFIVAGFAIQTNAQTWTQLTPTGTPPSPRGFHGVTTVYDSTSNRMIVFGGRTTGATNTNDVWVLTNANGVGGTSQWINLISNNAPNSPPLRSGHTAVYDSANNRMIIFGGCNGSCLPTLNDVWVLANANGLGGTPTWTRLSPSGGPPATRTNHTAIYDQANNRMIVFAGQNGSGNGCATFSDVWALSNANGLGGSPSWAQLTPTGNSPVGQYGPSAVYDSTGNRMIVFGGTGAIGGNCAQSNAVWALSNANGIGGAPAWTNLVAEAAAGSPPARTFHSAVYDATSNQMIMFAGARNNAPNLNDIWVLSRANGLGGPSVWSEVLPVGGPPSIRESHDSIYDVANKRMTIFGGGSADGNNAYLNDTWVLAMSAREIRVANASAAPGSTVTIPIELASQGDENALGFSLTYDPAILSNPQVALGGDAAGASLNLNTSQIAQGRLGIAVALPATTKFAAGMRQLVNVTFTIAANAQATTTQIGIGDQPIPREVVSDAASVLPASYTPGSVTVTPGYEADVSPRPNGNNNGTVTIADWVQAGRFAAGVDAAAAGSEFQRADCAPKNTKGDGRISIADWVQAGRYAAGVDAVVPAGGPAAPVSNLNLAVGSGTLALEQQQSRTVRTVNASLDSGQNGTLAVELDAQGNENAMGFSLQFDPAQLRFVSAVVGNGASGATLNLNTNQAANGRVGFAIALTTGQAFSAGVRQLVVVTFAAAANATAPTTAITLGDQPVGREIVDAAANALSANWTSATVTITRPVASVSAASFAPAELAVESIVAAFGSRLATSTQLATALPLPTTLAGTTVKVKDSAGVERLAPLFFVAPTQINYQAPPGTATGTATVTVTSGDGVISSGKVNIAAVAPGLFSANASGQGVAAAAVLRVRANGTQSFEEVGRFDPAQNKFVAVPIDLGPESDQVFLILFGTGVRYRSSLSAVTARIGGVSSEALFAGAQGVFVGLDQVNLRIPRSLAGRGEVDVAVNMDGVSANLVRVSVK